MVGVKIHMTIGSTGLSDAQLTVSISIAIASKAVVSELNFLALLVKHHVSKQRRPWVSWWATAVTFNDSHTIHDDAVKVRWDHPYNASIIDALAQTFNQDVVIDAAKKLLQIFINHDPTTRLDVLMSGKCRFMRTTPG